MLGLVACATQRSSQAPGADEVVEGLVRRRLPQCGSRPGFVLAVGSTPLPGRRLSFRVGGLAGAEVASVVTSQEGAFRAPLKAATYCIVDVTEARGAPSACLAMFRFEPKSEPVPVVVLPAPPCRDGDHR